MTDYHGSCQCGAVRFRFSTAEPIAGGMACNCSRCRRIGSVLTFVPRGAFTLEAGEDATTEYLFNKHAISHRFCATCGVQTFSFGQMPDGSPMVAVNLNAVDGLDTRALQVQVHDGAAA